MPAPRPPAALCAAVLLALWTAGPALAEDAAAPFPFQEGEMVTFDRLEAIRPFLPPELWTHRRFVFFEGMRLEIGPAQRDYGPAGVYAAASDRHRGSARLGPDGALEGYVAGQPFAVEEIDCAGDPQAGLRIIWNMMKRWQGSGAASSYLYTYWDRGERTALYYQGTSRMVQLAHRPEPQYAERGGDVYERDQRQLAWGIEVDDPPASRGILIMTYRYKSADGPLADAKSDDTWVYQPAMRRVRRIATKQRTDPIDGTDFTLDDLGSFSGIPPQMEWSCRGVSDVVAPVNTRHLAFPYEKADYDFGPLGLSFANDRWELRRAYTIRFVPRNADHPYAFKDIYLDQQTWEPLYSFAYDQKKELWKIILHNHRWSEDWRGNDPAAKNGVWYEGWEGVEEPRDLRVVSDVVINVQTGTGNRIEFWDNHGTPMRDTRAQRQYIDFNRLTRGR